MEKCHLQLLLLGMGSGTRRTFARLEQFIEIEFSIFKLFNRQIFFFVMYQPFLFLNSDEVIHFQLVGSF